MRFTKSHVHEFANSPSCHYSSLPIGETETGITYDDKTWIARPSEKSAACNLARRETQEGRNESSSAPAPLLESNWVQTPMPLPKTKGPAGAFVLLAERVGFEPTVRENRTLDFESSSFDHSDTSPGPLLDHEFINLLP